MEILLNFCLVTTTVIWHFVIFNPLKVHFGCCNFTIVLIIQLCSYRIKNVATRYSWVWEPSIHVGYIYLLVKLLLVYLKVHGLFTKVQSVSLVIRSVLCFSSLRNLSLSSLWFPIQNVHHPFGESGKSAHKFACG